ncbi:MAG: sigma-70 family RNA polymerase sigma factor [Acidobacteria bacterium]|nr:sigma-70 family RNA polymerase sigma factor [Acidobacteriota bacterium]
MTDAGAETVRTAVTAVRRGDRDAFARIVTLYERRLFGLALMVTRDPAGAEEVAQDAFVRAYMHLNAYDIRRPFYPWLSTIAVRLAQNWLVRRVRQATREGAALDPEADAAADGEEDPLAEMITAERDRRLWDLVTALPSGERTATMLYYRQDMSVNDIARAVGVSGGTVKTLLFRARQKLRRALGDRSPGKDS